MHRFIFASVALLVAPVLASATTINFDDFQQTTRITTYYAPQGLANVTNGAVYVVSPTTMGNAGFPTHSGDGDLTNQALTMDLFFGSPVSGVSLYYTSTSSTNSVVALNAMGVPLSTTFLPYDLGATNLMSIAGTNIAELDFTFSMVGGNTIDDLTFTNAATVTPEPSSFALLGTGLLGIAGMVRKRLA